MQYCNSNKQKFGAGHYASTQATRERFFPMKTQLQCM